MRKKKTEKRGENEGDTTQTDTESSERYTEERQVKSPKAESRDRETG